MNITTNASFANVTTAADATLRRGDRGNNVKALQVTLNYRGAGLTVDGDFGPMTEARVIDFQQSSRQLSADGIVGPQTWQFLRNAHVVARNSSSTINLREHPDRSAAVVQALPSASLVKILGRSPLLDENYSWFHVQAGSKIGWVREDFIQIGQTLPQPLTIVDGITIQSRPQPWGAFIDPELEAAIRSTSELGFRDRVRYLSFFTTFENDVTLRLAYLFGSQFCGSGGCTMLVLRESEKGYQVISRISTIRETVVVSNQRSNGYPDLIAYTAGGGLPAAYRRLRFNGTSYPTNATAEPALPAGTIVNGSAFTVRITPDLAAPLVAV